MNANVHESSTSLIIYLRLMFVCLSVDSLEMVFSVIESLHVETVLKVNDLKCSLKLAVL